MSDDEQERLLRAMRAPGSDAELSEEERYRAMFRAAHSPATPERRRLSRAPRRLLVGGATAVALAVGTGGVAAAYSGNLPSPIQTLAHHVIGAPEARPPASSNGTSVPVATTSPSPSPSGPTAAPSPSRSGGSPHPSPHHSRRPAPSSSAPASPRASTSSPSPSSSSPTSPAQPTSTSAPAPVLTSVKLVGTSHRADVGSRVSFSGQLTYAGTPRSRPRVVLQQQVGSRWTSIGQGRTDAHGAITFTAPPLQRTSRFRLLAGQGSRAVRSAPWRVAMHPLVTSHVAASKKKATIDVTAAGSFNGDQVTLVTRRGGRLVVVGRARLDASGAASILVTPDQRRTSYVLVLDPTKRHTSARITVRVELARDAGRQ